MTSGILRHGISSESDEVPLVELSLKPRETRSDPADARKLGPHVVALAKEYADGEDARNTKSTFMLWRWAVVWSVIVALCIVMEGYDLALMPNFFSLSSFKARFNDPPWLWLAPITY
jgi:hypothetical protein